MCGVYSSSNLNQATYIPKSTAKYINSVKALSFSQKCSHFSVLMSLYLTGSHPSHGGEIEKVSLSFGF